VNDAAAGRTHDDASGDLAPGEPGSTEEAGREISAHEEVLPYISPWENGNARDRLGSAQPARSPAEVPVAPLFYRALSYRSSARGDMFIA